MLIGDRKQLYFQGPIQDDLFISYQFNYTLSARNIFKLQLEIFISKYVIFFLRSCQEGDLFTSVTEKSFTYSRFRYIAWEMLFTARIKKL